MPAIWPPDARKLTDCGVETVHDLVDHVRRREGLSALSERSHVPVEQLRSYFQLAEKESSKARARRRGALWLGAVFVVTIAMGAITAPKPMTAEEKDYAARYDRALQNDPLLARELDEIVALSDSIMNRDTAPADSDQARRLDILVGGVSILVDDRISPHLANLLSLWAVMIHDDAVRAAEEGDRSKYESLVEEIRELDDLLEKRAESHREYAMENSRRARIEREQVLFLLRSTPGEAADTRVKSVAGLVETALAEIETELAEIKTALAELEGNLESERASLAAGIADSMRAMTARALDPVIADVDLIRGVLGPVRDSIDSIGETLSDHTELLEKLLALFGSVTIIDETADTDENCSQYRLQDSESWRDDLRRHIVLLPPLEDSALVTLELQVAENGTIRDVKASPSRYPDLDAAVVKSARDFIFRVDESGRSGCDTVTYTILFRR